MDAAYLAPEGPMAADAYAVMRDGMQGKAGIGKVAINNRDTGRHPPAQAGLVMATLHHAAGSDHRPDRRVARVRGTVNLAEMKLARQSSRALKAT